MHSHWTEQYTVNVKTCQYADNRHTTAGSTVSETFRVEISWYKW